MRVVHGNVGLRPSGQGGGQHAQGLLLPWVSRPRRRCSGLLPYVGGVFIGALFSGLATYSAMSASAEVALLVKPVSPAASQLASPADRSKP